MYLYCSTTAFAFTISTFVHCLFICFLSVSYEALLIVIKWTPPTSSTLYRGYINNRKERDVQGTGPSSWRPGGQEIKHALVDWQQAFTWDLNDKKSRKVITGFRRVISFWLSLDETTLGMQVLRLFLKFFPQYLLIPSYFLLHGWEKFYAIKLNNLISFT